MLTLPSVSFLYKKEAGIRLQPLLTAVEDYIKETGICLSSLWIMIDTFLKSFLAVASAAVLMPAWRAARVNPNVALRCE